MLRFSRACARGGEACIFHKIPQSSTRAGGQGALIMKQNETQFSRARVRARILHSYAQSSRLGVGLAWRRRLAKRAVELPATDVHLDSSTAQGNVRAGLYVRGAWEVARWTGV